MWIPVQIEWASSNKNGTVCRRVLLSKMKVLLSTLDDWRPFSPLLPVKNMSFPKSMLGNLHFL